MKTLSGHRLYFYNQETKYIVLVVFCSLDIFKSLMEILYYSLAYSKVLMVVSKKKNVLCFGSYALFNLSLPGQKRDIRFASRTVP